MSSSQDVLVTNRCRRAFPRTVLEPVGQINKVVRHLGEIDRVIYYMEFCQLSMPGVSPCDARTLYDGL